MTLNVELMPMDNDDGFPAPPAPGTVPLVDRTDFLEGSIDALEAINRVFVERFREVMDAERYLDVREMLDAQTDSGSALHDYAATLDLAAITLEDALDQALQQARWKLARVQKAEG